LPARPIGLSQLGDQLAYVYTGLGDAERAVDCLDRAFERGGGPMYGIKGSFLFEPLRHYSGFSALLARIQLA
jgi:hypothetical protein